MKIWKKISLLLCACFAFSSVATSCDLLELGEDSSSSSSSQSANGGDSSSSGNDDSSSSVEDENNTSAIIDVYIGMITRTLERSESAKLTFELETTTTASATDGAGTVGGWTNYLLAGEAIVSATDDGFNAKLDVQVPSDENPGQTEARSYYYIDGYVYLYNAESEVYEKSNETLEETLGNLVHSATEGEYTIETLIASLVGGSAGGNLGGDMSDLSYEGLEEAFSEYGVMESEITDTGMKITADASKEADELFDFIRTVDSNTTYGELLDYPLSQIDPDLSTASIIEELLPRGRDTVSELVEELDAKSEEETGKTLQENIDSILDSEVVSELLSSLELDEALVSEIENFEIEDFLKEDSSIQDEDGNYIKNGDLTLNDLSKELVNTLVEALGDDANEILGEVGLLTDNVTWALLVSAVEIVLNWEAFENIPEDSEFYELLDSAQALEVSTADMEFELKVNKTSIESFSVVGNFGGNATNDGVSATVGATLNMLVSEFSTERLTIELPEDATVVTLYTECAECDEAKESVSYREGHFDYYCDECFAALPEVPETDPPEGGVAA